MQEKEFAGNIEGVSRKLLDNAGLACDTSVVVT